MENKSLLQQEIEKEKQFYNKNKTINSYNKNLNYENYEEEIINGESILDCDLENIERKSKILSLYEKIFIEYNKMKVEKNVHAEFEEILIQIEYEMKEKIIKELQEQTMNFLKENDTIKKLIEITKIEYQK